MQHHYAQYGQNGQQPVGQGQGAAHSHHHQQQQQQQSTDANTNYQQYNQQYEQYQQYQQYYEYYQQQQQQHPHQHLQQQPAQQPVSFLPPSYSTPLPPPKSKQGGQQQQQQNGHTRQQASNPASQHQYHVQYQTALQKGAAAASAVSAALFPSSYGSATAASSLTPTSTPADLSISSVDGSPQQAEWFSSYKPPTLQQRMAVTMAGNTSAERHPHMNGRRNNNQRPGQQQKHERGNNNSNNQRGKQKSQQPKEQEKEQSTESKPVDGFHCDACDITFHEEAKLKIHASAHRSCPDCQYMASPSLVAEHRKVTHGPKNEPIPTSTPVAGPSGPDQEASSLTTASPAHAATTNRPKSKEARPQAPIKSELLHPLAPVLNTPEDIAAWIAKRRKAWPSDSNILKKEQERKEMIAKGQIVDGPSSKDENGRNKRKKKDWDQDQRANAEVIKKAKTEGAVESIDTKGNALIERASLNNPSEDENEDMDPVKDAVTSKDPTVMGKVLLPGERQKRPRKPCKFFLKGLCTKGDRCTYGHDSTQAAKVQKSNQASVKKEVFRSRPSLLKMLLSSEIKEEKNKLLEALRYIVVNNFFEKEESVGTLVEEVA
ncbi:nuclear fragile X mental retardation protein interacting protein 1 [Mortierella alpina]|uniref:Nuclear fragile X mental retardation protein interacting protein 1 n=1 Tax=Mortierella alpina TaxID=64518 RepID=A0A9P6J7S6_MORAP|nr:nuclear fragile X mental retardation protein interacting protein 1 [Mortierella alpina]